MRWIVCAASLGLSVLESVILFSSISAVMRLLNSSVIFFKCFGRRDAWVFRKGIFGWSLEVGVVVDGGGVVEVGVFCCSWRF